MGNETPVLSQECGDMLLGLRPCRKGKRFRLMTQILNRVLLIKNKCVTLHPHCFSRDEKGYWNRRDCSRHNIQE